jgi:hypothetical protein
VIEPTPGHVLVADLIQIFEIRPIPSVIIHSQNLEQLQLLNRSKDQKNTEKENELKIFTQQDAAFIIPSNSLAS